jgi:hypothetical protein
MSTETAKRQEYSFSITSEDQGKMTFKMYDRINPDDIVLHLIRTELARLMYGVNEGGDIPVSFKDFLIRQNFIAGQS